MVSNRREEIETLLLDMLDTRHPLSRTTLVNWTADPHRRGITTAILDQMLQDGIITRHPNDRYTLKEHPNA